MDYYINNLPGAGGSNQNPGTFEAPWFDFTPVNSRRLEAGDRVLLARGARWNQQLVIDASGDAEHWCELGAYGSGPRPQILRNGDAMERGIRLNNPSYWRIADLEVGNAGIGILVYYETPGHEGLVFENLLVHDCYGIFTRDMPESPARQLAIQDRAFLSSGILITGASMDIGADGFVLRDVVFDHIEGTGNGDSISLDPYDGDLGGDRRYAFHDVVLNHLYLHDDNGPNPGGIPDSLRIVRSTRLMLLNSLLDNLCGRFTSTGTAAVFLGGDKDLYFVNNMFMRTPDTGSCDQCAIDFEGRTTQVKLRDNFFGFNAGPGVEFLDIWGQESYSENHEVVGNAFEGNGWATHGGQAGSGGIHHYGGDFATGVIRDNLVYEPGKPMFHGEFVHFDLINNLAAQQALFSAMNDYAEAQGSKGWRYQYRLPGGDWLDLPGYDAGRGVWQGGGEAASSWIGRFEQLAASQTTSALQTTSTGPSVAVARAWQAPQAGQIAIRGRVLKSYASGNPVQAQITLNGAVVWGPQAVVADDRSGIETHLDRLAVVAGDIVRFEVAGAASGPADATSWAPTIAYVADDQA